MANFRLSAHDIYCGAVVVVDEGTVVVDVVEGGSVVVGAAEDLGACTFETVKYTA